MPVLRSSKLKDIVGDRGQRSIWKVVAFGAQFASGRGVCRAPLTGIDPQWRRPLVRVQWPVVVLSRIELDGGPDSNVCFIVEGPQHGLCVLSHPSWSGNHNRYWSSKASVDGPLEP